MEKEKKKNGPVESSKDAAEPTSSPKATRRSSPTGSPLHQHRSFKGERRQYSPPPPNSTIVMKNLDFNLEEQELEEVLRGLSGGRLAYKNFYFHHDAAGQFRGMAFVNFHSTEDATKALSELMHVVLNGRKVFVEYRRMNRAELARKEQEEKRQNRRFEPPPRQTFELDDTPMLDENGNELDKRVAFFKRYTNERGDAKFSMNGKGRYYNYGPKDVEFENKYRELLTAYRDEPVEEGKEIEDFKFKEELDSGQRLVVHQLCDQLGLAHISRCLQTEDGDENATKAKYGKRVIVVSKDPEKRAAFKEESIQQRKQAKERAQKRKEAAVRRKQSKPSVSKEDLEGITWFKPRAQQPVEGGDATKEIQKPSYKLYVPPRQPTGPDGTVGFKSRSHPVDKTRGDGTQDESSEALDSEKPKDTVKDVRSNVKPGLNPNVPAFIPSASMQ